MSRKTIFKGLIAIVSVAVLLISVLVIHVAMVTKSKNDDKRIRQIARIDFKEQLDPKSQEEVKSKVLTISGVDAAYYNSEDHILVYSYNPDILHSDIVYYKLMEDKKYKAERFVVTIKNKESMNACPIIDKSSFSYQFATAVKEIIN